MRVATKRSRKRHGGRAVAALAAGAAAIAAQAASCPRAASAPARGQPSRGRRHSKGRGRVSSSGGVWEQHLWDHMRTYERDPSVWACNRALGVCIAANWKVALGLLLRLRADGVAPNMGTYNSVMSACKKRWEVVVRLFSEAVKERLAPDPYTCTEAMVAWGQGGHWKQAMAVLILHGRRNLQDLRSLMSACKAAGEPRKILEIFADMRSFPPHPTASHYGHAIWACGELGNFKQAISFTKEAEDLNLSFTEIEYTEAIMACARHGQWEYALHFFSNMRNKGIKPDVILYCAVIKACESGGRGDWVIGLWKQMLNDGLIPDHTAWTIVIEACSRLEMWDEVALLIADMRRSFSLTSPKDSALHYNAFGAYEHLGAWEEGLALLSDLVRKQVPAFLGWFGSVAVLCAQHGRWSHALSVVSQASSARLFGQSKIDLPPDRRPSMVCAYAMEKLSLSGLRDHAAAFYKRARGAGLLLPLASSLDMHEMTGEFMKEYVREAFNNRVVSANGMRIIVGRGTHSSDQSNVLAALQDLQMTEADKCFKYAKGVVNVMAKSDRQSMQPTGAS